MIEIHESLIHNREAFSKNSLARIKFGNEQTYEIVSRILPEHWGREVRLGVHKDTFLVINGLYWDGRIMHIREAEPCK